MSSTWYGTLTKAETFALYSLLSTSILLLQLGRWSWKSPRLSLCFNGPIDMPNQNCSVHPPLILVGIPSIAQQSIHRIA